MCLDEAVCNFWSFSPSQRDCWLKYTKGENGFIQGDADRISGNKACGNKEFARAGNGKLCEESINLSDIHTAAKCEDAAKIFGLKWFNRNSTFNIPGDHPRCLFADDRRQQVFFNLATPSGREKATKNYDSICKSV